MDAHKAQFARVGIDVPVLSLEGVSTVARVVSVYDGDTITAIVPFLGTYFSMQIRLHGIDTSEMKSKDENAKKNAVRARNTLLRFILPSANIEDDRLYTKKEIQGMLTKTIALVWLRCYGCDKYGRTLADIYDHENAVISYSQRMIECGLAYAYDGGAKHSGSVETTL